MTATAQADLSLQSKTWHRYEWLLLGLIVVFGASLRIARARFEPLIFDEIWHLELSTGRGSLQDDLPSDVLIPMAPALTTLEGARPWYAVWTHMTGVVDPPLFNQLLRIWREAFGAGDLTARMFSIFWSLLAIILLYFAGRSLHGPEPALWAALIFAAAPMQVWIDQHIRGYAMLQALSLATILMLILLEKSQRASTGLAASLGAGLLLIMLTHYFALAGALAIGVYVLLRLRGRKLLLAIASIIAAAVIYAMIWLPFMLPQRASALEANFWISEPTGAAHILNTFQRAIASPARMVADFDMNNPLTLLFGLILIIPLFLIRKRPQLLLWYLFLLLSIGFIASLDLARGTKQLSLARYVSPAAPACFILFALMAAQLSNWLRHTALIGVVLAAMVFTSSTYKYEQADWIKLARTIDDHVYPDETIVYYAPLMTEVFYLATSHYSHQFPRPVMKLSHPASAELVRQIPGKTAWLITSGENQDISKDLPGTQVIERFDFPMTPFQPALVHVQLPDGSTP